ncbi:MAG: hypothetical protein ACR2K5_00230 [Pseudolabrys sp.]
MSPPAIAIILNVIVYWMKTMIPLRILAIAVDVLFITHSVLAGI